MYLFFLLHRSITVLRVLLEIRQPRRNMLSFGFIRRPSSERKFGYFNFDITSLKLHISVLKMNKYYCQPEYHPLFLYVQSSV